MLRVHRVGIGMSLALVLPTAALAQQPAPSPVPLELVQALLAGPEAFPEVRVGVLPEAVERALRLPEGTRMLAVQSTRARAVAFWRYRYLPRTPFGGSSSTFYAPGGLQCPTRIWEAFRRVLPWSGSRSATRMGRV